MRCFSLLLLLATAVGCRNRELNGNGSSVITRGLVVESIDTLYYLDLIHPTLEQPVALERANTSPYKFVQVEVAQVTNPKKHPLTFEVRYQSEGTSKIFLGSFSLYPSDNPGKFIVPTQGKVSGRGVIVVSLTTPDKPDNRDTLRVALRKITVLQDHTVPRGP